MGPEPSEVDCAMFGMLVMILWNMPDSKHEKYAKGGCLGRSTGPEYLFFFYSFVYIPPIVSSCTFRMKYSFQKIITNLQYMYS